MRYIPFFLVAIVLLLIHNAANAQTQFLDPSFGNGGIVVNNISTSAYDEANAVVIQPDGKIVIAGIGGGQATVIRYLTNGAIDSTFATKGIFTRSYLSWANAIVLQPDGKMIVTGENFGGTPGAAFPFRLNVDGSLDNTFNLGGRDYKNNQIALQADGKIILTLPVGPPYVYVGVTRLLADGRLDSTFGNMGLVVTNRVGNTFGVSVMADGRIVTGGSYLPGYYLMAMRFLPDGRLDSTFNHIGEAHTLAGDSYNLGRAVLLQPDGKIVVGGSGTKGAEGGNFTLIRYNLDGSLDRSFGDTGVASIDFNMNDDDISALTMATGSKIMVAGSTSIGDNTFFALTCINSNGRVDSSFGMNGRVVTPIGDSNNYGMAVAIQQDRKVILAGGAYSGSYMDRDEAIAIVRYTNWATAVEEVASKTADVVLYPNPASGTINLNTRNNNHITGIAVHDVLGNSIPVHANHSFSEIKIDGLANGIYYFTIHFDNQPPAIHRVCIQNR